MNVGGRPYRTIFEVDGEVRIIDQTRLPHEFRIVELVDLEAAATAIRDMKVRGAPLIGAAAAWGVALGMRDDASDAGLDRACERLLATRPTAVNLRWALDRARETLAGTPPEARPEAARDLARRICDEDVETNRALGHHASAILRARHAEVREARGPDARLNVLTHCNAGWLATVDRGTATSGIYEVHDAGLPVHVWVDETRPRAQGARLTAWELGEHGIPHTVVPDTAAAHLMARGDVDLVIVGTDRTTARGDVVNKIGTRGVALAAFDAGVPFWVAAPSSSLDFTIDAGDEVEIERRSADEVARVTGPDASGTVRTVRVIPEGSTAANWAFDVTPARLVTGIVTERGTAPATREGLAGLFPDRARRAGAD